MKKTKNTNKKVSKKTSNTLSVRIKVTQESIDRGFHDAFTCPIAEALIEKGFKDVVVGTEFVHFTSRNKSYETGLTKRMAKFVSRYDSDKKVVPTEFKFTAKLAL